MTTRCPRRGRPITTSVRTCSSNSASRYSRLTNSIAATMTGTITMTIQAPSPNLAIAKMTVTMAVASAPAPLIVALRRQPGPRSTIQWRTIPDWDSVNAVKTPIAYRGIRASTRP